MLREVYTDQRYHEYQGPSRTVRHPRACTVGGGTFATSEDGSRCVVAGQDVLRILRVTDPSRPRKSPSQSQGHIPNSGSADVNSRICTGPGGASIEIGSNMWTGSGLKIDSAPTDVVWARGPFDNKIVTSARNGEIIYWDINKSGSKYETRIKEHKRAVNKLAISPCLPYLFASGSQDGHLRIWDLRTPPSSSMKVYHPTGIRALSLCPVPSNPMTVCTGLESGNIQRWDLRTRALPLERITLAHSSSILSMDWQLPSMRETGLGWLVTSGMDRRVKIWDLCLPLGTSIPANSSDRDALLLNKKMGPQSFRTLHTPFPVRNVCWRPGYDLYLHLGVKIVSNNESESETVEIWDIRRGWIGKWALDDAEGGITDITFAGSHKLWAQHVNGAFVQHDLRESFRPLDAIPRVAMSWAACGSLAFAANSQPMVELPFDDVHPSNMGIFHKLRLRPKSTSDPVYIPHQQTLGIQYVPIFDYAAFASLAKSYVFEGNRTRICEINAERAREAGQIRSMHTWLLLLSQLVDLEDTSPPSIYSIAQRSHMEPPNQPVSASVSVTSHHAHEPSNTASASYMTSAGITRIDTRPMETSPLSYRRKYDQSTTGDGTPSSSSSPHPKNLPPSSMLQPKARLSTSSLLHDTLLSPSKSNAPSRRASTVLPIHPRTPRPPLRRASISTPGAVSVNSASEPSRSLQHIHVGEGALDDSDSSSEHSATEEYNLTRNMMETERTPTVSVSPIARLTRNAMLPSPLLKLPVPRKGSLDGPGSPDSHLAGDEGSIDEYDSDTSEASHSPASSSSPSSSGSKENTSPPIVPKSLSHDLERQPGRAHNPKSHRQRGTSITLSHRSLTKQESQNSMRTVTAPSSDTHSARGSSVDRIPSDTPEPDSHKSITMSSEGMPTRRPSPQAHPSVTAPVPALGLSNMDDTNIKSSTQTPNIISSDNRLSECQRREIKEEEAHFREIGWKALRESLDWFAERGDVQMCALLALVAPIELHVSPVRAARFFEAYIDMLSRLRLHTLAAHLRKYVPYDVIRDVTQIQTTVYSSCGQCGTPCKVTARGGPILCEKCKSLPTLCAVCHLPVRKLLIHCTSCGHGGHQACYREFYLARPLSELPTHKMRNFPYGTADSYSSTDASSTTYYSFSDGSERGARGDDGIDDDDDSEQDGSGGRGSDKDKGKEDLHEYDITAGNISDRHPKMRVLGHACAAGCGHWCWVANERFTGTTGT